MTDAVYRSQSQRLWPTPTEHFSKPLPRSESLAYRDTRRVYDDAVLGGVFSGRQSRLDAAEPLRPSTSSGVIQKSATPGRFGSVKVYTPTSPALLYAAEVRTNRPLPSPLTPGKAITTDYADTHYAYWPPNVRQPATYVPNTPSTDMPSPIVEDRRPKLSRWRSIKGFLGKKASHGHSASLVTSPTEAVHGSEPVAAIPTRAATQSRVHQTRHAWSGEGRSWQPWRITPAKHPSQKVQTYVPTRGIPEDGESHPEPPVKPVENNGFQGGHKFNGGTTTASKPMLDVEIPDIRLERYSVMFGSLTRTNTAPTLLVRRQSKAKQPNKLMLEPLQPPNKPYLDTTKPCPPTPRSAAKYQLSLFPQPSPRSPHIHPIGTNKPRPLLRSHTSPSPRSKTSLQHAAQLSVSSNANTLSEEVPVRLDDIPDDLSTLKPARTIATHPTRSVGSLRQPNPSSTTLCSETLSSDSEDKPVLHIVDLWKQPAAEPQWDMVRPTEQREQRKRGSSESTVGSAAPTAFSGDTAVERSPVAQVSVARQMSLKRARSVKKDLGVGKGKSPSPTLGESRSLTPTVVEVGHRAKMRSHCVEIEGL